MSFEDFLELSLNYFAKNGDLGTYFQSATIDYFSQLDNKRNY